MNNGTLTLIDTHVHIYDCFNLGNLLSAAYRNFEIQATLMGSTDSFDGVLLLTESKNHNWFNKLKEFAEKEIEISSDNGESWHFKLLKSEPGSLIAETQYGKRLLIAAGRQVVTAEGLEVSALMTVNSYPDGEPIGDIVDKIRKDGGLPLLPWGVGKWTGRRGKIVNEFIANPANVKVLLGDNSGRPSFWKKIDQFVGAQKLGVKILSGTDPLPLSKQENRVGKFGIALSNRLSSDEPVKELKRIIESPDVVIQKYGNLESLLTFIYSQVAIRCR